MGLSFTSVHDSTHLTFLDLDLYHENGCIHVKNHYKPTAGNSYLHYHSCHHPRWLNNVPKIQFCQLRHNYTKQADYQAQGITLKKKKILKRVAHHYSFKKHILHMLIQTPTSIKPTHPMLFCSPPNFTTNI